MSCYATYRQVGESGNPRGGALPSSPSTLKKRRRKEKRGRALLLLFFDCIDTLPFATMGLVLNCCCPWLCCRFASSCCCSNFSPLLVCGADQYIVPGPEFGDSLIPAENCGPVSSDVHVLDRHVCILYKFMFYIYIYM
jgi:hypothetical protein